MLGFGRAQEVPFWRAFGLVFSGGAVVLGCTCGSSVGSTGPAPSASGGLDPEQAKRVLAHVGERVITLGDFAQALERMDRFERLRYQTADRRKLLLDEMVNTELLAREAERRGIDQQPSTQAALNQLLRDEVLRELREAQPALEDLPSTEVQAFYAAHPGEFTDPERRRVSVIAVRSLAAAQKISLEVAAGDPALWTQAVRSASVLKNAAPKDGDPDVARPALELAGDLGLVSALGEPRGGNPQVPDAVRSVLFSLGKLGDTGFTPAATDGLFYVVRLTAKTPARVRTLSEADTMIRSRLLKQRVEHAENELSACSTRCLSRRRRRARSTRNRE
jgi:peptidyl-prolyl cis-trans isomerase C